MENSEEEKRKVPEGLSEEEIKVWNEVVDILNNYRLSQDGMSLEELKEIQKKKVAFGNESRKKGINPQKYLLWHLLVESGVPVSLKLDLDDHIIENKIKEIFAKFIK